MSVLIVGLTFRLLLKMGGRKQKDGTLLRAAHLTTVLERCCNGHY